MLYSPIHPINHYLVHNYYGHQLHYPLDSDLSRAYPYPPFQQLGLAILFHMYVFICAFLMYYAAVLTSTPPPFSP